MSNRMCNLMDINPLVNDYYLEKRVLFKIPKSQKTLRKIVEGDVGKYKKFTHMCDEQNRPLSKYLHNRRYSIEYDENGMSWHRAENHTQIYDKNGFLLKDTKKTKKGVYISEYEYNSQGTCIFRSSFNEANDTTETIMVLTNHEALKSTIKIVKNDDTVLKLLYSHNTGDVNVVYQGISFNMKTLDTGYNGFIELSKYVSVRGIDFDGLMLHILSLDSSTCKVENKFDNGELYFQSIKRDNVFVTSEIENDVEDGVKIKKIKKTIFTLSDDGKPINSASALKTITQRFSENKDGSEMEINTFMNHCLEDNVVIRYDREGDKIYEKLDNKERFYVYKEEEE